MIKTKKGDKLTLRKEEWFQNLINTTGRISCNEPHLYMNDLEFSEYKSLLEKYTYVTLCKNEIGLYVDIKGGDGVYHGFPYWCFEEFNPKEYNRDEVLDVAKRMVGEMDALSSAYELIFRLDLNFA